MLTSKTFGPIRRTRSLRLFPATGPCWRHGGLSILVWQRLEDFRQEEVLRGDNSHLQTGMIQISDARNDHSRAPGWLKKGGNRRSHPGGFGNLVLERPLRRELWQRGAGISIEVKLGANPKTKSPSAAGFVIEPVQTAT